MFFQLSLQRCSRVKSRYLLLFSQFLTQKIAPGPNVSKSSIKMTCRSKKFWFRNVPGLMSIQFCIFTYRIDDMLSIPVLRQIWMQILTQVFQQFLPQVQNYFTSQILQLPLRYPHTRDFLYYTEICQIQSFLTPSQN